MFRLLSLVMLLAFTFAVGVTPALAAGDKAEKRFKKLDKNGDGKLSVEEFVGKKTGKKAEKAKKAFAKRDKNDDKFLSLEEFKTKKKKNE